MCKDRSAYNYIKDALKLWHIFVGYIYYHYTVFCIVSAQLYDKIIIFFSFSVYFQLALVLPATLCEMLPLTKTLGLIFYSLWWLGAWNVSLQIQDLQRKFKINQKIYNTFTSTKNVHNKIGSMDEPLILNLFDSICSH